MKILHRPVDGGDIRFLARLFDFSTSTRCSGKKTKRRSSTSTRATSFKDAAAAAAADDDEEDYDDAAAADDADEEEEDSYLEFSQWFVGNFPVVWLVTKAVSSHANPFRSWAFCFCGGWRVPNHQLINIKSPLNNLKLGCLP